ncbi:hypothetical protein C9374_000665 [Naegleria lovaniensis]|uniref:Uncharacterized protein n=1 Tax=Naegleria lovaniensis TaxID=51637 RepID=A0AA88GU78_NAELO|nr:uncharacterized protein C9374_000665 [Naegleria lovaniensis]KAG2388501.1 hypothetical protein C9374_000665 [Naegleria lovaniensis]
MPPFKVKQEHSVKAENAASSTSGSLTTKRNFVGVRDLQKSGASAIDYANMFKRKTTSSKSSSSSSSHSTTGSSSSSSKSSNTSVDVKPNSRKYERKSSSSEKKSSTKRYRKSSTTTPKKIEKSDKVRWTTYRGKKCVIHNGKKIIGPKAMAIYNKWKELNKGNSDTEESAFEKPKSKKKTSKTKTEPKAETSEKKPLTLKKKGSSTTMKNSTITDYLKKEEPETVVVESSDEEIESFASDDEFEDPIEEIISDEE